MNKFEREPFSIDDYRSKNKCHSLNHFITVNKMLLKKEKLRHIFQEPHNMETVGTINGVKFINDSWATNINRTWYTLERLETSSTPYIILILGGYKNDYEIVWQLIKEKVKAVVFIGKDCRSVEKEFKPLGKPIVSVKTMQDAVINSSQLAKKGDTVLLSPGYSSFDYFKDQIDRGNKFIQAVKNLD